MFYALYSYVQTIFIPETNSTVIVIPEKTLVTFILYYRVIALISVNIVSS